MSHNNENGETWGANELDTIEEEVIEKVDELLAGKMPTGNCPGCEMKDLCTGIDWDKVRGESEDGTAGLY